MMETKKEIVTNWLVRYTDRSIDQFTPYILLCNFTNYLHLFAEKYQVPIIGLSSPMPSVSHGDITLISFGMGSPNAATIMDLLSAIMPAGVIFLGKCGSMKSRLAVGEYLLPIAAIRGEETSDDYMPPEVPSLPSFKTLLACSDALTEAAINYHTGTVYTTNRRVWEHDSDFKEYLIKTHCEAVDMETATLFTVAYANRIPAGALLMASDAPLTPGGVKTGESDKKVTADFLGKHLDIGIAALQHLQHPKPQVQNIRFGW